MSRHSDVVVVGAGPGGLACSMLLAKAGINVTILEKSDDVGGRTRVFEKDGFKYDNGPTFFHYPEIAEEIFAYVLRDMTDEKGGFYSAEDADSEGEEGKFYVWTNEDIVKILGNKDGGKFIDIFGLYKNSYVAAFNIV